MQNGTIVNLENIRFSYPNVQAIDDVSLTMENGIFGLLGPNGAGKTTLIKILLGFLAPQSGRGEVFGLTIGHQGHKGIRRHIGYMPESDCLIPGMDAVALTAYLGELSGMPHQEAIKRAHDVLYYVGLGEARYRQVETYSAGMKQRLKLAQALVHDPRLLLLDEPTSGMDPSGRKEILELIRDISAKGRMSIIISTHLLADIEYTCQHVIIMNQGRIITRAPIVSLSHERFNSFEVKLKGDAAEFLKQLRTKKCQVEEGEKNDFHILLPAIESSKLIFAIATRTGVQIRQLKKSQTTLEDAFLKAIGEADGD